MKAEKPKGLHVKNVKGNGMCLSPAIISAFSKPYCKCDTCKSFREKLASSEAKIRELEGKICDGCENGDRKALRWLKLWIPYSQLPEEQKENYFFGVEMERKRNKKHLEEANKLFNGMKASHDVLAKKVIEKDIIIQDKNSLLDSKDNEINDLMDVIAELKSHTRDFWQAEAKFWKSEAERLRKELDSRRTA